MFYTCHVGIILCGAGVVFSSYLLCAVPQCCISEDSSGAIRMLSVVVCLQLLLASVFMVSEILQYTITSDGSANKLHLLHREM